jgi:Holliday junction resolvase RusA-like endonuclease
MEALFKFSTEVPKHWSLKNNNRIRRAGPRIFVGKEQALINDKLYLTLQLRQAWGGKAPICHKIHARFRFYFANYYTKKGDMNMKLGDLSNLLQLPEDALQDAGVIFDDAFISSHDGSRKLPSINGKNILEIELYSFEEPN